MITLPYSEHVVRLRPVDISVLLKGGEIPDILSSIAYASLFQENEMEKIAENPELLRNWDRILRIIIPAAFVEPKVALDGQEPAEDEIAIEDIHYYDRMTVFNYVTAGARALYTFRGKQGTNGQTVPHGQNNGRKTKRASRAK